MEKEKSKETPVKTITPITTAKVLPATGFKKFKAWLNGDAANSLFGRVVTDVVIPAGKEILSRTFDMLVYKGEGRPYRRRDGASSRVSYDGYYDRPYSSASSSSSSVSRRTPDYSSYMGRAALDYDNIYVDTRTQAIDVLEQLDYLLNRFNIVTVADLYQVVNIRGAHTANKYGWTDLSGANFVSTSQGYLLKFPRAMPID